ncbi:MAG: M20/M25/M40 family metallo-hydrolase [Alphaproteobacteria bacterium]|nr:M20/M25/M40 family metallo-hydrolase [Alphaproteobacteria bacterium]
MTKAGSVFAGFMALLLSAAWAADGAKNDPVMTAAQGARESQLGLLQTVVNIDSGTGDVEGGRKVAAILIAQLKMLGAEIETVPAEAPDLPDNIVATVKGLGKARILMIGHIDTVFGQGTVAARPYTVEGNHARGPGVADEKGGVVEGLCALKLLHDLRFDNFGHITFLIETSEERGSPGTKRLVHKLLADSDVELNLEPGDPPDIITVWRKGSAVFHIDVKGKAAHAGVNPQDGHNAAVELMHQLLKLESLPHSGPGVTVNTTVIRAGERSNIIPDAASAQVNVRVRKAADFSEVQAVLERNAQHITVPGTTVTVSREAAFPPLPDNPATAALAARAQAIYASIGNKLGTGGNGGASESALAAEAGVPALDGLGPVGGGFHSDREYLDLTTVTPRLYLLTKLLISLSEDPPSTRIKGRIDN